MAYSEMKTKHSKELNDFPMFFAFDNKQFEIGLKRLNVTIDQILSFSSGGFIRKTDSKKLQDLFTNQDTERKALMLNDEFLISAIEYELGNHEFIITYDPYDTIYALDLDMENERTIRLFNIAKKRYLDWQRENG